MKEKTIIQVENNEQIQNLPLSKLAAFENHPFRVAQDEDFQKLVESIKENGVLIPAIARPKGEGYELIAGHRRKLAAAIVGLDTIPVLVRDLSNEQAIIAMVDSNVQRENILPSEKAFAYKMKLEAIKRTGAQLGHNEKSRDLLAKNSEDSREQIRRYIRLTALIPHLLKMVDEKRIAFNPAVELSYLPEEQQEVLFSAMQAEQATPSLSQAQKLKSMSADGTLTEDSIMKIMREQKANQKEQVRIPYDKIRTIIKKDMPPKELEDFILKAVADYQKKLLRQQQSKDAR
ncbi:MAG: ParB/RepB/Spo0J family partition protein [Oscillospiraceae bacterium]|nr:ParB/RepB/Spo0J family partition protein [Oscillospiraceae bacterium]MDD4414819.1 ParB/RepB/Spo0J family partition protein [Oscillospiraceae bacterium]